MEKNKNIKLEKFKVCAICFGVGMIYGDCVCMVENEYKIIELEFEVCKCCDNIIKDGDPADTDFNKKQIEKFEKENPEP